MDFYPNNYSCFFYRNIWVDADEFYTWNHIKTDVRSDAWTQQSFDEIALASCFPYWNWIGQNCKLSFLYFAQFLVCPKCFGVNGIKDLNKNLPYVHEMTSAQAAKLTSSPIPFASGQLCQHVGMCQRRQSAWRESARIMKHCGDGLNVTASDNSEFAITRSAINTTSDGGIYCITTNGFTKIGKSSISPEIRAKAQLIPNVRLEWILKCSRPDDAEAMAHKILSGMAPRFKNTEWFAFTGCTKLIRKQIAEAII